MNRIPASPGAKQIIETGEVLKSDASMFPVKHAAQPAAPEEKSAGTREGAESLKPSLV